MSIHFEIKKIDLNLLNLLFDATMFCRYTADYLPICLLNKYMIINTKCLRSCIYLRGKLVNNRQYTYKTLLRQKVNLVNYFYAARKTEFQVNEIQRHAPKYFHTEIKLHWIEWIPRICYT